MMPFVFAMMPFVFAMMPFWFAMMPFGFAMMPFNSGVGFNRFDLFAWAGWARGWVLALLGLVGWAVCAF